MMTEASAGSITMSSREIADLLDMPHDDVKGAMERLANAAQIRVTLLVEASHLGGHDAYAVVERDSRIVVADLAPEAAAKLDAYWQSRGGGGQEGYTTDALDADAQQIAAEASAALLAAQRQALRLECDRRRAECDWTMLMDADLTPEKQAEWRAYRLALRAMPETADPADPQWPEVPE